MGGGGFGGDGSVEWDVHGDNVFQRHNSTPQGPGGRGRRQTGNDATPEGPLQFFTVRIKLPRQGKFPRGSITSSMDGYWAQGLGPSVQMYDR